MVGYQFVPETSNSLTLLFVDKQPVTEWFPFGQVTGDGKGRISGNFRWIQNKINGQCRWPGTLEHAQSFFHLRGTTKSIVEDANWGRLMRSFRISSFRGIIELLKYGPSKQTKTTRSAESDERNEWACHYLLLYNEDIPATVVRSAHTAHIRRNVKVSIMRF